MFDNIFSIHNLFLIVWMFLFLRGVLGMVFGKKKRRSPQQEDNPDYDYDTAEQNETEADEQEDAQLKKQQPDLATDFERRLRKSKKSLPQAEESDAVLVNYEAKTPERRNKQRIHYDSEPQHECKERIHRDNEGFVHDKSKLYRDSKSDYSYDEAKFNQELAEFSAKIAQSQEQPKTKLKLKHSTLVNGFIMSQVLDKPRSIKPYGSDEIG